MGGIDHNLQQCAWNNNSEFRFYRINSSKQRRWWSDTCSRFKKIFKHSSNLPSRFCAIQEVHSTKQDAAVTGSWRGGRRRYDKAVPVNFWVLNIAAGDVFADIQYIWLVQYRSADVLQEDRSGVLLLLMRGKIETGEVAFHKWGGDYGSSLPMYSSRLMFPFSSLRICNFPQCWRFRGQRFTVLMQ